MGILANFMKLTEPVAKAHTLPFLDKETSKIVLDEPLSHKMDWGLMRRLKIRLQVKDLLEKELTDLDSFN